MMPRPFGLWAGRAADAEPDYYTEPSDCRGSIDDYDRSRCRRSYSTVPYGPKRKSHERPMNTTTNSTSTSTLPSRRKRARTASPPNAPKRHDGKRPPKLRRTAPSSPADTLFANTDKVRTREKELVRENRELKGRLSALHAEIAKLRRRSPAALGPGSSATAVEMGGLAGEVHRSFDTLWGSVVRYVAPVYLGDSGLQVGCDAIKEKINRIEALGGVRELGDGQGNANGVEVLVRNAAI
ncbi:hypothetical protein FQN53_000795 [Emmonsiellopsis sp. PD_33]|nr:hypothetical protein FQN53_000795 [Emmonsiellopsis sp. PD_33]